MMSEQTDSERGKNEMGAEEVKPTGPGTTEMESTGTNPSELNTAEMGETAGGAEAHLGSGAPVDAADKGGSDTDTLRMDETNMTGATAPGSGPQKAPFQPNSAPMYRAPRQPDPEPIRPTGASTPTIVLGCIISLFALVFLILGLIYLHYGQKMTQALNWSVIFPAFFAVIGCLLVVIAIMYWMSGVYRRHRDSKDLRGTAELHEDQSSQVNENDASSVGRSDTGPTVRS